VLRDRDTNEPSHDGFDERLYAIHDSNRNTSASMDVTGDVLERYEYTSYGDSLVLDPVFAPQPNSIYEWTVRYAGYAFELSLKAYCVRHRLYIPGLGGWAQRDPLGNTDDGGLYTYVRDNPVRYTDPLGLFEECVCGPDVTDWFREELKIHTTFFKNAAFKTMGPIWKLLLFKYYAARLPYGYLKYKSPDGKCPQNKVCADTVTFMDACIHRSDLGNIMFGAMGVVWMNQDQSLIGAGAAAGKQAEGGGHNTGGIDSVEDMTSVIVGILFGGVLRETSDAGLGALQRSLGSLSDEFIKALMGEKGFFTSDRKSPATRALLGQVDTKNPLQQIGRPFSICRPCAQSVPKDAAHSDFTSILKLPKIMRILQPPLRWMFWDVYTPIKSNWIDNSEVIKRRDQENPGG